MRILIFILLISSCAQKNVKKGAKNEDFAHQTGFSYNRSEDRLPNPLNIENNVLVTESLGKIAHSLIFKYSLDKDKFLKATQYCHRKNSDAFKILESDFKNLKMSPVYWNIVGTCYALMNENEKAILYYQTAIDFHKQATKSNMPYVPAINNIGVIYAKLGEDQKAFSYYKEVIKWVNKAKTANFNLAQLYLKYGLVEQAKELLLSLYSENKKDPDIISGLAISELFLGQGQKAKEFFEKLQAKEQNSPYIGLSYSYTLVLLGEIDKAYKVFQASRVPEENHQRFFYNQYARSIKKKYEIYLKSQELKNKT